MLWQDNLFHRFFDPEHKSGLRAVVDRCLLGLIVVNVLVLWPMTLDLQFHQYADIVGRLSLISYSIFGIEYVLRLLASAGDPRYRGRTSPLRANVFSAAALADLLVLLPVLAGVNLDVRILKLVRALDITGALRALGQAYAAFRQENCNQRLRRQFYALLYKTPTSGNLHAYLDNFLMTTVLVSVVLIILESVASLESKFHHEFFVLDCLAVFIFTLEYIGRLYVTPENPEYAKPLTGRLRFAMTVPALIDLVAIAPFFLTPLIGHLVDLRFIRIFRLVRLVKLTRYTTALNTLRTVFAREAPILGAAGFLMLLLVMLAASLGYLFEHEAQPDKFENIPQSIYWAVVTLASVGYGDLSPVTPIGRFMTVVMSVVGLGIFALPAGVLSSAFSDQLHQDRERLNALVDDALSDGVLSDEEMTAIKAEAKRLHLNEDQVERLISSGHRRRGFEDHRRRVDEGGSAHALAPAVLAHVVGMPAASMIDWKQNPELAFMQLNQWISSAQLVVATADAQRLQDIFDDPTRATDLQRQIFSVLQQQSGSMRT